MTSFAAEKVEGACLIRTDAEKERFVFLIQW